jgi:hypothetical protein
MPKRRPEGTVQIAVAVNVPVEFVHFCQRTSRSRASLVALLADAFIGNEAIRRAVLCWPDVVPVIPPPPPPPVRKSRYGPRVPDA